MKTSLVHTALASTAIALLLGFATGCERPFIEFREPDIEVVFPDPELVLVRSDTEIAIRATSFRNVDSVKVAGIPLEYDESTDLWKIPIRLNEGLNTFVIAAVDEGGIVGRDTLELVSLPVAFDESDIRLLEPTGGHSATRLDDGTLLIAGGSRSMGADAFPLAYRLSNLDDPPERLSMLEARVGHSANRLPDGRVLLLGGSTLVDPPSVEHLVSPVEVFDPTTNTFTEVGISGDAVQRAFHTTTVFPVRSGGTTKVFLYVYGGTGNIRIGAEPRLGIRSDLRTFEFRNDSLISAGPTLGIFLESMSHHTQTDLFETLPPGEARFVIAGSYFATTDLFDSVAFEMRISTAVGIRVEPTATLVVPRLGHASARIMDAVVLVIGGRQFQTRSAMRTGEVYLRQAARFFRIPDDHALVEKRWGLTATNWPDSRILLLGGFDETGNAVDSGEWFELRRPE
jgi:hypothetical protein